jgi:signal peptidase
LLAGVPLGVLTAVALVVVATGLWPPVYTVVSGSMAPNVEEADLVVVVEEHRTRPVGSRAGVVTATVGQRTGYRRFGDHGDVLIFRPNGSERQTPVIHRARFWVERGENWYEEANPAFVKAEDCGELRNCPAPHAGFVTKGDANGYYDQSVGISEPVRPGWIRGVTVVRVRDGGQPSLWLQRQVHDVHVLRSLPLRARTFHSRTSATFTSESPPQTVASCVSAYRIPARSVSTRWRTSYVVGSYSVPTRSPASIASPSS